MRVKDLVRKDYKIASVEQTVSSALERIGRAEWVVIKQKGNLPVGLIETEKLADYHGNKLLLNVIQTLSPLVLVPAEMEVEQALQSPILHDLPSEEMPGAVVMRHMTVHGIWPKSDVALLLMGSKESGSGGMSSSLGDVLLPGEIGIERPTITCSFTYSRRVCPATAAQAFAGVDLATMMSILHHEKGTLQLPCPNPLKLKPHHFGEKN